MDKETKIPIPRTKKLRVTTYLKNPFMEDKYPLVVTKTKRITNNRGGLMVKSNTGETVSPIAGFWHAEEVDATKFVKLYINGVKAFSDLSSRGTKVFELMYYEIQNNIGKDKIYLNFSTIDQDITKISRTTFYDGLNELVEKKFLAPTETQNWFWLNPDYVWNGDRLSFVKTYVKKHDSKIPTRDTKTIDLFGNLED
jgi:hypothetical protein